mgnify:CR=1 FL=1
MTTPRLLKDSRPPKMLRTGDPRSNFHSMTPAGILGSLGFPASLLSTSTKVKKSAAAGTLTRILYLTPGPFCPGATPGCLAACNGHSSGRMPLEDSTHARDKRTAFFIEHRELFLARLEAELHILAVDARILGLAPSVRLNGTSDLAWERLAPQLFERFPQVAFYDYTKLLPRMLRFLRADASWPRNYHLTFSEAPSDDTNRRILDSGGNVAVPFWPELPPTYLDHPVLDGDRHDARFLDLPRHVIGLRAKGLAKVDLSGFTKRPCPRCGDELMPIFAFRTSPHIRTSHRCACGFELRANVRDPYEEAYL